MSILTGHPIPTQLLLSHPELNLTLEDRSGQTPFAVALGTKDHKSAEAILSREPNAAERVCRDNDIEHIQYHTVLYYTIPSVPYHTIPCHTVPYHTVPYHTIPYRTVPYHTIPCHMSCIPNYMPHKLMYHFSL